MLNIVVIVTYFSTVLLASALVAVHWRLKPGNKNTNPQFLEFQRSYFLAFYPALFADWLNAPYLYKLFADYGFLEEQIAIIYVCGLMSALVFGTPAGYFVQRYGPRKISSIAAAVYSLSCFLKLSSDYSTLVISRVLSGASTTLLFAAHEGWYSRSHLEGHDFPKEWLELTSAKAAFASSFMASAAGLIAYMMTEWYGLGPVAPSILAVPFLGLSAYMAFTTWKMSLDSSPEEGGLTRNVTDKQTPKQPRFAKVCCEGLQNIVRNPDLLLVGSVQSLFESVLCLFVFLWTPVLDHHNPPLGIVFASFMSATLCGGYIYKLLSGAGKVPPALLLSGALIVACVSILGCVFSTAPTKEFPVVSYIAFLVFETAAGAYFSAMSEVKRLVKPELQNFAVTAWFRVPLNLFACFGLVMLHHSTNATGTRHLFTVCFFIVGIAVIFSLALLRQSEVNALGQMCGSFRWHWILAFQMCPAGATLVGLLKTKDPEQNVDADTR